jgi:hypothetical protein
MYKDKLDFDSKTVVLARTAQLTEPPLPGRVNIVDITTATIHAVASRKTTVI